MSDLIGESHKRQSSNSTFNYQSKNNIFLFFRGPSIFSLKKHYSIKQLWQKIIIIIYNNNTIYTIIFLTQYSTQ